MSVALKHTVRVATLALLVAGLSGCGSANPVGPSLAVAPATETMVATMPIEQDPATSGDMTETSPTIVNRGAAHADKKVKKDNPGQHRGWNAQP